MNKLTLIDKTFFLKKMPLFRTLTLEMLLPIADKLILASFDKETMIFDIGDEAHRMYFLVEGLVEIQASHGRCQLESGAFFGDEALFNESRRAYRALTVTEATILILSQTNLLTIISEHPNVALEFLNIYASTLPNRAQFNK